jgi:hypothetical protein
MERLVAFGAQIGLKQKNAALKIVEYLNFLNSSLHEKIGIVSLNQGFQIC